MDLAHQLILHEGERLKPYVDTVGKITIGVGRNLSDVGISRDESRLLLEHDIERALRDCATFPWWATLDPIRQRVIADMCFNLSLNRLGQFGKTLAAIQAGDFEAAGTHMLQSKWARQVGARADRLAAMMRTGEDFTP